MARAIHQPRRRRRSASAASQSRACGARAFRPAQRRVAISDAWTALLTVRRLGLASRARQSGYTARMEPIEDTPHPRNRHIYLLPNLLTTCGLFAGFYAIMAAAQRPFRARLHRGVRRRRVRRRRRPGRAPDRHQQRIRRAVRLAGRPGQLRHGAGAGDVPLGAGRHEARTARWRQARLGAPPSSTPPARRCGWRASTPRSASSTSAGSSA